VFEDKLYPASTVAETLGISSASVRRMNMPRYAIGRSIRYSGLEVLEALRVRHYQPVHNVPVVAPGRGATRGSVTGKQLLAGFKAA